MLGKRKVIMTNQIEVAFACMGAVLMCGATIPELAFSAQLPSGFSEVLITDKLTDPVRMQFAPDGRLFISQQNGQIRIVKDGTLLDEPFLTLSVDGRGEHGVLGLA